MVTSRAFLPALLVVGIPATTAFLPGNDQRAIKIALPSKGTNILQTTSGQLSHPSSSVKKKSLFSKGNTNPSATALNLKLIGSRFIEATDNDLIIGYVCCLWAVLPYLLGVVFPKTMNKLFFLPVYDDDFKGRRAEIYWKVMYASLAFGLTSLAAWSAIFNPELTPTSVLRRCYILWAIFYAGATAKIRYEYKNGILGGDETSKTAIQAWHIICLVVLWLNARLHDTTLMGWILKQAKALFA